MPIPPFVESLSRGSTEPLLSVTPGGRILSWTRRAEAAFGFARGEAIGRQLITLAVPSEGVDELQSALREAFTAGRSHTHAIRRRKDGSLTPRFTVRLERRGEGPEATLVALVGQHALDARLGEEPAGVTAVPLRTRTDVVESDLDDLRRDVQRAMTSAHSAEGMLQNVADLLVPRFADWVVADLLDPRGAPARVAAAHQDPTRVALVRGFPPSDEDAPAPVTAHRALRSAQAEIALEAEIPPEPWGSRLLDVGCGSHLVLPVVGRTRLFGALTLVRALPRRFTPADAAWAQELLRTVALEIENASLLRQLARQRESERRATERARMLHALSKAFSEPRTPAQVTEEAVAQARLALEASGGAIAVLSDDHTTFEVAALVGEAAALSNATLRFPVHASLPLADAARSNEMLLLEHTLSGAPRYAYLARPPVRPDGALAVQPLVIDGRCVGALGLVFPTRRIFTPDDLDFIQSLARLAADALERARLYHAERRARALADAEARRSGFLADASRILSSSFDYRATLEATARLVVPHFADWCVVYLRAPDGGAEPVATAHADDRKTSMARDLMARSSFALHAVGGVVKVLDDGRPEVFADIPHHVLDLLVPDATAREALRDLGLRSQITLPLIARQRTVGAIALYSGSGRRLSAPDMQVIEELARRAALAVDNARLYHDVEEAYRRKEESIRELRESEERYRLLVDSASEYALMLLDANGRIASWNPGAQRLLGYTADEIVGSTIDIFYLPEDRAQGKPQQELAEAVEKGRSEEDGWRIRKDGTRYWANIIVTVLRDEDGNVRGFSKLHRDTTESKLAREELENARARVAQNEKLSMMGTLVSGVAHEIRTPLTAIANSLHLIRLQMSRGNATPDALERHTALALEGVERVNHLVQDLRRFRRGGSAGRTAVSLDEVVAEALDLFRAAHRGRVEIQAVLVPTPTCEVDCSQLQQAVLNLLQNASEADPHGGLVEIRTGETEDGRARIEVEDHGMGMTPEVRARMFDEFYTTKPEGTGLGLSIVRRILELHDAALECESEPGQGSKFTMLFRPATPRPAKRK